MAVLFKPILALHIINFSSCRNYWGEGAKRYVCPPPPNIFMGGGAPRPPGSTPLGTPHDLTFVRLGYFGKLKKNGGLSCPLPPPPPPPTNPSDRGHRLRAEFGMNINHDVT